MAGLVRGNKGLIYPTNFAVSSDTATVQIGYPYQIPYTITPANATNQKIDWISSNASIATVDNKGVITAVSTGTCTITGVYSYDGTTVTVAVTATEVHTTGVSLDKHSLELNEGGIDWLHATLTPSNTSYPGITWSSSDTNVATVSSSGTVKYVGGGTCTITCTTVDGGYIDTCSVTCLVKVKSVELNEHSININPNGTHQLTATVLPNDASDKSVTWSSSDTSIATVNNTGLVTYAGAGTCTITVTTTDGGFTDTCEVVCGIPVTGVSLNYSSGEVQASSPLQLVATITPSDASNKNVTWSSSNTSIATVSNNGLVTYAADGSCTITCTTVDGGFTATCSITASSFAPVDRCFGYTGSVQSITLKPHKYCLEVRGAEGGCSTYHGKCGGRGGYASGCFTPTSECTLYIYVGGKGNIGVKGFYGGWNGGGGVQNIICYTCESNNMGSGGGATDIAALNCPMSTDSYYRYIRNEASYNSRIIVAGGGGGAEDGAGGAGGGTTGCGGQGGTQSSAGGCCEVAYSGSHYPQYYCYVAGGKGYGASVSGGHHNHATAAPGGGGYYGGGIQGCVTKCGVSHGSGGSGYIGGVTNGITCDGAHSFPTASGGTETGHMGNGCVRIRSL